MYLSKIKLFIVLLIVLSLTSCATSLIGENNESEIDPSSSSDKAANFSTDKNEEQSSNSAKEGLADNKQTAFSGVDPMSDIQINIEIKSTYGKVAKLSDQKQYAGAIKLLDSVQLKYPQLSGPDYQKARIYFNQGKLELALKAVDFSLLNNTRNYYSLNLKGIILREQGKFEEAREIYFMAIEAYPPYPNSHLNLGVLADIYMRDLPLALLQYREYMKLTFNKDKKDA
ncbi:MAG: tetratricopeptide repeat protein, partial [Kangiellaceae bacterium]|nr:tetratricopeptide repeat protein [Kangiellaceae bacterium]